MNVLQQIRETKNMLAAVQQTFNDRLAELAEVYLSQYCPFAVGGRYVLPSLRERAAEQLDVDVENVFTLNAGRVFCVSERQVVWGEQNDQFVVQWQIEAYFDGDENPRKRRVTLDQSHMALFKHPRVLAADEVSV